MSVVDRPAPPVRAAAPRTERPLRIAVWHNLPSGGGKRALYHQVRGLVERGHHVEAWTLDSADREYLPLEDLVPEHVVPFRDADRRMRARLARVAGVSNSEQRMRRMHEACAACARQMRERGMDLVFASSCRFYGIPFIGRHAGIPAVAYLGEPNRVLYEAGHLSGDVLPWIGAGAGGVRGRLRDAVARAALASIAREEWRNVRAYSPVLVNSYFTRESFLRAYGADATVCYLGIDTGLFRDLGLRRERMVVGLGSFDRIKGIDLAVRALALLPKPSPPLVWIANSGDPVYRAEVEALAGASEVPLEVRSRVTDDELVSLLNRASLLLYTSRLEPFGYAPLEANACGAPVVAVAEGGVRETVADGVNGLLADRAPERLAGAVHALLADPARAAAMGAAGARTVRERWSLEASLDRVEGHLAAAARRGAA